MGTLQVTGYLRGPPLSVNRLVHIPGYGDYQMSKITAPTDPNPLVSLHLVFFYSAYYFLHVKMLATYFNAMLKGVLFYTSVVSPVALYRNV